MCNRTIYKRISMAFISIPTSIGGVNIPGKMGKIASGPLSVLFTGKGVETKRYPLDLGTDATKLHYVQFSISEVIPADFGDGAYLGKTSIKLKGTAGAIDGLNKLITELPTVPVLPTAYAIPGLPYAGEQPTSYFGISNDSLNSVGSVIQKGITDVSTGMTGVSDFLKNGFSISPRMTQLKAVISLYMPDTIDVNYNAEYDEMSLTGNLPVLTTIRQIDAALAGTLKGINPDNFGKMIGSTISTDPSVIGLASKLTGVENVGTLLTKARGYSINPQLQMIYRGLDLRSFQLVFTFTPKSAQEAKEVGEIIALFKKHYAPTLALGAQSTVDAMYLVPPSMFNVQFMHDKVENIHLPKYGDCVITNIDVNYTPNGFATYEDGSPVQTVLMLQFKEVEAIDRGKLDRGELR